MNQEQRAARRRLGEPEPAIIKPGQRLDDDALKITATGSVYREVKK